MTKQSKAPKKLLAQKTNKSRNFIKNPQFQPILIIGVLIIAGVAALLISMFKPHPFDGSRQAADTFMQAYVNCDFKTAQKYYTIFQVNADISSQYQKTCIKGGATFSFVKTQGSTVEKKGNITIKNISYLYNYTQKNAPSGEVSVYMEWLDDTHSWIVFSVTPVTAQPSAS